MATLNPPDGDPRAATTTHLVAGIVADTRDLLGAHVDTIRGDFKDGVGDLKQVVTSVAAAMTVGIIAAILLCLAIASTLVELGLQSWAAMWIVTGVVLLIAAVLALRARARARRAVVVPAEAVEDAADDAKWLAERTRDAVIGEPT